MSTIKHKKDGKVQNWSEVPRNRGKFTKWTEVDYNKVYSSGEKGPLSEVPDPMPRDEFLDYVKENHTAESNINEELVAKTIDFAGHDLKRKEEIAATVADNFTKEEIRKMTEQGHRAASSL